MFDDNNLRMWRKEAIPPMFKDASIIHLYTWQRIPHVCDSHGNISVLSIVGILLSRVNEHIDQTSLLMSYSILTAFCNNLF